MQQKTHKTAMTKPSYLKALRVTVFIMGEAEGTACSWCMHLCCEWEESCCAQWNIWGVMIKPLDCFCYGL